MTNEKAKKKIVNLRVRLETTKMLSDITEARKEADRLDWSQSNIVHGLVEVAHKKEVKK